MTSEYSATVTNLVIDNNAFTGQTFEGTIPEGDGFSGQFNVGNNAPRQLVVLGAEGQNTSNVTFTNNEVSGTAGGINANGDPQGNTLVTIDAENSVISGNTFTGFTNRYAYALRAREDNTDVVNNTFDAEASGSENTARILVESDNPGEVAFNTQIAPDGTTTSGGSSENDFMIGTFDDEVLAGAGGDDRLFGLFGDDTLDGGTGNDRLFGGLGDDRIDGGEGRDHAWGGFGDDVFAFSDGDGRFIVHDFQGGARFGPSPTPSFSDLVFGRDMIEVNVDGFDSLADILEVAEQRGLNTVLDFGNGDSIVLKNTLVSSLDEADFSFPVEDVFV
nr:hypothetical protein [Acuticoccus kalidii]